MGHNHIQPGCYLTGLWCQTAETYIWKKLVSYIINVSHYYLQLIYHIYNHMLLQWPFHLNGAVNKKSMQAKFPLNPNGVFLPDVKRLYLHYCSCNNTWAGPLFNTRVDHRICSISTYLPANPFLQKTKHVPHFLHRHPSVWHNKIYPNINLCRYLVLHLLHCE